MRKRFTIILAALALVAGACGGSSPSGPDTSGGGGGPDPTPPIEVCNPKPVPLPVGWTLEAGRGSIYQMSLPEKEAIKVTLVWSPAAAWMGVTIMVDGGGSITCNPGQPCEGTVDGNGPNGKAADLTTNGSPKVVESKPLDPGSYWVVLSNLGSQDVSVNSGSKIEYCK